ncbi:MAG TPA: UDP-N-acetylmuramate--L-alanine ligase [Syntrophomonas sp.]|jgi:UDP-N-acetylmuramate--alanine ligase|nr:UDP-N-acetylmuramate--L-alanine ligase [Syntrophomonas sp.]
MTASSVQWVHMVGIGGAGMSGIAKVLAEQGLKVSGSDLQSTDVTRKLADQGVTVYLGHSSANLKPGVDLVVASSAIPKDNSELTAARESGIPILKRGQMLAYMVNDLQTIAVAGAHGKTTTTSMVFQALCGAGLDPTFILGGELQGSQLGARLGKSPYCVVEADESDASFLELRPYIAVITNIEDDHLDFYGSTENILKAFRRYFDCVKNGGFALVCGDDTEVQKLLAQEVSSRVVTYGEGTANDYYFTDWEAREMGSRCQVFKRGLRLGSLHLSVPGRHNTLNAIAAVAAACELGLPYEPAARALQEFSGAKRRFHLVGQKNDITVIDDYAHHPTEIEATIAAARQAHKGRLTVIFQPHRFTRTQLMGERLGKSLVGADTVFVTDIYSAGEPVIPGITAQIVYDAARGAEAKVYYVPDKEALAPLVAGQSQKGDLIITMGAGDVWKLGPIILEKI